MKFTIINFSM